MRTFNLGQVRRKLMCALRIMAKLRNNKKKSRLLLKVNKYRAKMKKLNLKNLQGKDKDKEKRMSLGGLMDFGGITKKLKKNKVVVEKDRDNVPTKKESSSSSFSDYFESSSSSKSESDQSEDDEEDKFPKEELPK